MEEEQKYKNNNYIYKIINILLFLTIIILSYYFDVIKILKPLLIFLVIFILYLVEYQSNCLGKTPILEIFDRSIIISCIYLYSEYTVKCIPILDLTLKNIFNFRISGNILKCIFSFLITIFGESIINNYLPQNNKKSICNINKSSVKLLSGLILLSIIVVNSYLENIKEN